jgi:hypothetical protein
VALTSLKSFPYGFALCATDSSAAP